MSQRAEKVAGEIREVIGEMVVRGAIKDPRVRDAGLITITYVRITGDLRQARVFFTVHGADDAGAEKVEVDQIFAPLSQDKEAVFFFGFQPAAHE